MLLRAPHYLGHRQRLRERFLKSGLDGFADYEVVELLLTLAIPRSDVKQPAKALIARFGNLRGILDAPIEELRAVNGIGSVTPVALKIIKAAATLYLQQSGEGRDSLADPTRLSTSGACGSAPSTRCSRSPTSTQAIVCFVMASKGWRRGRSTALPSIRAASSESALRRGAAAIVLAHNHPNGNVTPSEQDKLLTRALVLAAETVQLKIVDHLIVSVQRHVQLPEGGTAVTIAPAIPEHYPA